ncbi:MAG: DUF4116 domain-containing protein, partial [Myxococcaceae bacterium]
DQECSQEWYDEAGVLDALYDSKTEELGGLIVLDWITDRKTPEFKIEDVSQFFPKLLFELVYMDENYEYAAGGSYVGGFGLAKVYVPFEEMHYYYSIPDLINGLGEEDVEVVEFDNLVPALLLRLRKNKGTLERTRSTSAPKEMLLSIVPDRQNRLKRNISIFVSPSAGNKPKTLATVTALCGLIRAFEINSEDQTAVSFDLVPEKFLSTWVAIQLCLTNGANWKHLPKRFYTQKFFDAYIRGGNKIGLSYRPDLGLVPKAFKSSTMIEYVCRNLINGLEQVSKKDRTRELCKLGVSRYGRNLSLVPIEFRDSRLCRMAVKIDGVALQYVPKPLRTLDLCKIAVAENSYARNYVPKAILKDLDAI